MYNTTETERRQAAAQDIMEVAKRLYMNGRLENDPYIMCDAKEFQHIANCLLNNHLEFAKNSVRQLNSIVREQIPVIAWEFVGMHPAYYYEEEFQKELKKRCAQI